ncbi:MAG TPA: PHP domain-containing protein [Streptosporangiaceae bacterium]|nr:PHP domain-containing protein [Streptosporangiaceae bacterium]
MYADLHAHSLMSDGWYGPAEVVDMQAAHGVGLVALTDHDTFAGVARARDRAVERGLAFVVGVEITVGAPGHMHHLLAHGPRPDDPALADLLAGNRRVRRAEALAVQAHLRRAGMALPDDPVYDDPDAVVMPHTLARAAIRARLARHDAVWAEIKIALARLPAKVYAAMPDPVTVAEAVHGAGGLLVWAHPALSRDAAAMRGRLPLFDAVEVLTPRHDAAQTAALQALCLRTGKPATTGRDFHGYPRYERPPVPLDPAYLRMLGDRIIWPDRN